MKEEEEKNNDNENNINLETKIDEPKYSLSLFSIHDFQEKRKKTNFTSKTNNRWIYIKDKKDNINPKEAQNEINNKEIDSNLDEEKVLKTLEKWKNLQKSIKEELSLEELMIEKQKQDNSQLKEKFRDYYKVKLKSRNEYEKIKNIDYYINTNIKKDKDKEKENEYIVDNNIEKSLLDTCEPIKNLMFLFRNYYDYTVKLISLISENDEKEKIDSLVELFCNQFYDNILIPSQNQDNVEISLLLYKLLEDEIISMNSASIDDFLSENSFIGKFITLYVRKDEFRLFFGKLLNPIILNIENSDDDCLDISLANIKSKILKNENNKDVKDKISPITSPNISINNLNKDEDIDLSILYKDITKTCIEFKKNNDFDEKSQVKYNNEDNLNINASNNINIKDDEQIDENAFSISDNDLISISRKKSVSIINEVYNYEYSEDLNQEKIINKILNETNKDMKDFYIHQLEQIGSDPDIFTNSGLKNVMNEFYQKNNKKILYKYKQNFLYIKDKIDTILQELINKINIMPSSLKCICKLISILINKKFPNLPKYFRNSFIGKFLFDKCIFPILSLDSKNAIINKIFSSCTKKCINVIVNVLSNANRGYLYMTNSDTEKTIFNYYLIEIIPILNEFYDKLIDIKLPTIIEKYVSMIDQKISDNIDNRIFKFKRKKILKINNKKNIIGENEKKQNKDNIDNNKQNNFNNNSINNNIINENQYLLYDYFIENPDEIMRLQSICFSIPDILFILKLISRGQNQKKFKNLNKYDFFNKTVERIKCDDYKLEEQEKTKNKTFFIVFKDERNNQIEKLFMSKKKNITTFFTDEKMDKDPSVILKRIKFYIKYILKNLDLNFSYLNKAISTDKFFSAIYHQLNEEEENTEILDKVPIKWYSQYIYEKKNNLDINYRKNDYQLLYNEILEEENEKLAELKNITSKIITKNNINLNCAEELLNRINFSYDDISEEKKCAKIEKFVDTEEIKVCILTSKEAKDSQKIMIRSVEDCPVINNEYHNNSEKNKYSNGKISCHTHYIKDFITKFSYNQWEKDTNRPSPRKLVKEDIKRGNRDYKIYQAFKDYMDIIKKRIKAPINNKNLFNDITDYNEILEKIEDYILREIYKYVYPEKPMDLDNKFEKITQSLGWITPSMLEIKKISINQLDFTQKCIEKLDKANSVNDKLNCIRDAHASLNNAIKFSDGTESDAGQDEITPIFQYIIIKAQPKRIFSNINYIKTFLDESELSGSKGFLLTQIESATSYIEKINHESLKMTKEEFDDKKEKWKMKLNK